MKQQPSVGRIVHYCSYGTPGGEFPSVPRAAVITEVGHDGIASNFEATGEVGLAVLNPTGMFFNRNIPYSETLEPGHWSWPSRV